MAAGFDRIGYTPGVSPWSGCRPPLDRIGPARPTRRWRCRPSRMPGRSRSRPSACDSRGMSRRAGRRRPCGPPSVPTRRCWRPAVSTEPCGFSTSRMDRHSARSRARAAAPPCRCSCPATPASSPARTTEPRRCGTFGRLRSRGARARSPGAGSRTPSGARRSRVALTRRRAESPGRVPGGGRPPARPGDQPLCRPRGDHSGDCWPRATKSPGWTTTRRPSTCDRSVPDRVQRTVEAPYPRVEAVRSRVRATFCACPAPSSVEIGPRIGPRAQMPPSGRMRL
jgi:hypothetical protein